MSGFYLMQHSCLKSVTPVCHHYGNKSLCFKIEVFNTQKNKVMTKSQL